MAVVVLRSYQHRKASSRTDCYPKQGFISANCTPPCTPPITDSLLPRRGSTESAFPLLPSRRPAIVPRFLVPPGRLIRRVLGLLGLLDPGIPPFFPSSQVRLIRVAGLGSHLSRLDLFLPPAIMNGGWVSQSRDDEGGNLRLAERDKKYPVMHSL